MNGPGGTIAIKAVYAAQARAEAAERWSCDVEEITVTGTEAYKKTAATAATAVTVEVD